MNAWQEAKGLAVCYLGTSVPPEELRRGDIIIGFHQEPVFVVESAPVPHPTRKGWWTVEKANRYGVGSYVITEHGTESVGRIPLTNADPGPYRSLLGEWVAPCGCVVNRREHCATCGPYNGASPLCVNSRA